MVFTRRRKRQTYASIRTSTDLSQSKCNRRGPIWTFCCVPQNFITYSPRFLDLISNHSARSLVIRGAYDEPSVFTTESTITLGKPQHILREYSSSVDPTKRGDQLPRGELTSSRPEGPTQTTRLVAEWLVVSHNYHALQRSLHLFPHHRYLPWIAV